MVKLWPVAVPYTVKDPCSGQNKRMITDGNFGQKGKTVSFIIAKHFWVFCIACKGILSLTGSRHSFHTVVDCIHVAIHPHLDSFDPILSQTSTRTILAEVSRPCHACFMPSLPLHMTHILVNSQSFSLLHLLLTAHPREQTERSDENFLIKHCQEWLLYDVPASR